MFNNISVGGVISSGNDLLIDRRKWPKELKTAGKSFVLGFAVTILSKSTLNQGLFIGTLFGISSLIYSLAGHILRNGANNLSMPEKLFSVFAASTSSILITSALFGRAVAFSSAAGMGITAVALCIVFSVTNYAFS